MMSDVFRRVYERKTFKSAEERNLFLDKMVAWFDRLFDAWQDETMDDLKPRLRGLGVSEEELNETIVQIEGSSHHVKSKRNKEQSQNYSFDREKTRFVKTCLDSIRLTFQFRALQKACIMPARNNMDMVDAA